MNIRTAEHYREMLAANSGATFNPALAASAIFAARHGHINQSDDCSSDEWREIVRDLQSRYGEHISSADLSAEIEKA